MKIMKNMLLISLAALAFTGCGDKDGEDSAADNACNACDNACNACDGGSDSGA